MGGRIAYAPQPQMNWRENTEAYLGGFGLRGNVVDRELEALSRHDIPFTMEQRKHMAQDIKLRVEYAKVDGKGAAIAGVLIGAIGADGLLTQEFSLTPTVKLIRYPVLNELNHIPNWLIQAGQYLQQLPWEFNVGLLALGLGMVLGGAARVGQARHWLRRFYQHAENVIYSLA